MLKLIRKILRKFKIKSIFYVGSTDILPPPLAKEKEDEYIKKAQNGDIFSRNKLIEHNLRLVVFLAKKYENTGVDLEDLVSIGSIGLIKGINTFSTDKNIKLATYCSRCIDNEILMYLRKTKKTKVNISLEESLSHDADGNELKLEDILGTEEDLVTKNLDDELEHRLLMEEINKLNSRDKEIMVLRYGLNGHRELTQKEVAEKLSISQSYISRIEKKVIKRLKNIIKI